MVQPSASPKPVVLFDGVCNLCNGWVSFLVDHDPEGALRFGSLQSPQGRDLLARFGREVPVELDSVILVEGDRVYERSTAVLRTLVHLGGGWRLFRLLLAVPGPARDAVYRAVAASRYRLFGRRETCRVATPAERERFIDAPSL